MVPINLSEKFAAEIMFHKIDIDSILSTHDYGVLHQKCEA
jgi:hypothetical protein